MGLWITNLAFSTLILEPHVCSNCIVWPPLLSYFLKYKALIKNRYFKKLLRYYCNSTSTIAILLTYPPGLLQYNYCSSWNFPHGHPLHVHIHQYFLWLTLFLQYSVIFLHLLDGFAICHYLIRTLENQSIKLYSRYDFIKNALPVSCLYNKIFRETTLMLKIYLYIKKIYSIL